MAETHKYHTSATGRSLLFNQSLALYVVGIGYHRIAASRKSNMRFIFIATDHFSKCIEAEPFFKIEVVDAIRLVKSIDLGS